MSLKSTVTEFVGDILKLDVTTLTGNLEVSVMLDDKNKIDFSKIMENLKAAPGAGGSKVKIVATSKIEFDQDVVQYVQEGADADLLELHDKTVKSSQEARAAFVGAIIKSIKGNG